MQKTGGYPLFLLDSNNVVLEFKFVYFFIEYQINLNARKVYTNSSTMSEIYSRIYALTLLRGIQKVNKKYSKQMCYNFKKILVPSFVCTNSGNSYSKNTFDNCGIYGIIFADLQ